MVPPVAVPRQDGTMTDAMHPEPTPELLQFPYSHYNEKARWALDYKAVPHNRRNLLPGPHAMTTLRLTRQTQVPIVRFGEAVIHGSARIIDELENRFPDPALYPADPALRRRALEIATWFDQEIGPQVRCAIFATLLQTPGYVCRTFAGHRRAPTRIAYRTMFPLTRTIMKRSMGITGQVAVERAIAATQEALEFVARHAAATGHLVGTGFTVADLTAAALLAPTVMPPHSPMDLPEPRPAGVRQWLARWADHPGAHWVLEQYRHHRPASAEATGGMHPG
jgi:glutathione S-transferase